MIYFRYIRLVQQVIINVTNHVKRLKKKTHMIISIDAKIKYMTQSKSNTIHDKNSQHTMN